MSILNPALNKPLNLSRTKIDLFIDCPRCFYLDRKLGVPRPPGFPFSLNSAVDALLKKEFDIYRLKHQPHPLIAKLGINAVPFFHKDLDKWRNFRSGIRYLDKKTNFLIYGAIDDLWQNKAGELVIAEYKATARAADISEMNEEWHAGYKRQMEIYQWLFRKNGFKVSDTGYFVYCNGIAAKERFDAKLEFRISLIPYKGDDSWVSGTVRKIRECLDRTSIPAPAEDCEFCRYRREAGEVE